MKEDLGERKKRRTAEMEHHLTIATQVTGNRRREPQGGTESQNVGTVKRGGGKREEGGVKGEKQEGRERERERERERGRVETVCVRERKIIME